MTKSRAHYYRLGRDHVLRTLYGHTIEFKKDEPTLVPYECIEDVQKIGGEPIHSNPKMPETRKRYVEPMGEERENLIIDAVRTILDRNNSDDFTGGGVPTAKAVGIIVGFEPSRTEIGKVNRKIRSEMAGG